MKVRWTANASFDLGEIARYIAQDNPDAALRVARAIFEACESLSAFPERGRTGRVSGTREIVVSPLPYVVVYRVKDGVPEVLRIYPGARGRT